MANLIEGLQEELDRCEELLNIYRGIGPVGTFGATIIQNDIAEAKKAMAEGDTPAMLRALSKLREAE